MHCGHGHASCRARRPEVPWATGLNSIKDKPPLFPLPGDTLQRASSILLPGLAARQQTDRQGILAWFLTQSILSLSPLSSWALTLPALSPPCPATNNQLLAAPSLPCWLPISPATGGGSKFHSPLNHQEVLKMTEWADDSLAGWGPAIVILRWPRLGRDWLGCCGARGGD